MCTMHNLGSFLGVVNTALMRKQAVKTFLSLSSVRSNLVWANFLLRTYSQDQATSGSGSFVCYSLPQRTLVKIHGHDTNSFLQGLVTNDMELLEDERCMYSHMLNVQGRTLYDIMFYR